MQAEPKTCHSLGSLSSSDIVEIEDCGPTTWQHLRCMVEGLGIADSQRKEGLGVEECLEDRSRLVGPVAIDLRAESLPGSRRDDLQEPRVEAFTLVVLAQCFDDLKGQVLQVEDFEALMVKAIEGVFETPVAFRFLEKFLQCR